MPSATAPKKKTDIAQLSINAIRFLSVDAVEKAKSGHPGTPMALAPIAYTLYTKIMKHNPKNPYWANRDRFVREPRVHGVAIRLRAHRDGTHAERASGPNDAAGNLAAIGDQQRAKTPV